MDHLCSPVARVYRPAVSVLFREPPLGRLPLVSASAPFLFANSLPFFTGRLPVFYARYHAVCGCYTLWCVKCTVTSRQLVVMQFCEEMVWSLMAHIDTGNRAWREYPT